MTGERWNGAPLLYLFDAAGRTRGEIAEFARDDARHLRALRAAPGDAVRVTDARGVLWAAELAGPATVRLVDRLETPPRLPVELWTAIGNKQATLWMVEKATEFGLERLCPVESRRSASVADAGRSTGFWEKAERRALGAVKQSGCGWLPEIAPPVPLADRLAGLPPAGGPRIVLEREAPSLSDVLGEWRGRPAVVVLVGPEGGLEDDELESSRAHGFRPASLAPTILRFETAAVAALAVVAQHTLAAMGADA